MNVTFDSTPLHQEQLNREIDAIQVERLVRSARPSRPALPSRARSGIGRGLIYLGTWLVGTADAAAAATRAAGTRGRA